MDQKAHHMTQIPPVRVDLVIVGAGIVGLGAALAASKAGKQVAVVERNWRQTGASVRNFGHVGITLQEGQKREYATRSKELWRETGAAMREDGAVIVARGDDELALIEAAGLTMMSRQETLERVPVGDERVTGGAFLNEDAQLDPRTAVGDLAAHLESRGVSIWTGTNVTHIEEGLVHTNRGPIRTEATLVAVNNEVERFFPEIAREHGIKHCMLDMIAVEGPRLEVPLLTGTSLLRYASAGDAAMRDAAKAVRERFFEEDPELHTFDINEMYAMRPDGMLLAGDTHRTSDTVDPFQEGAAFDVLERLTSTMFGMHRPRIIERWQGVYATAPEPYLIADVAPGVRIASITTGLGMTTGLAFAEQALHGWILEGNLAHV